MTYYLGLSVLIYTASYLLPFLARLTVLHAMISSERPASLKLSVGSILLRAFFGRLALTILIVSAIALMQW
jgi:hypothetical protein